MRALSVCLICLLTLAAMPAMAQSAPDVRIVVDVSGSMKQNDPQNLRANALEFAATLLPPSTRSSIWTFGTTVANPLPGDEASDNRRQRVSELAPQLTDYQQFTDIEQALRRAGNAPPNRDNQHLILLTDGMVDLPISGGDKSRLDGESRQRIIEVLSPNLAARGVVVHAIALSRNVDQPLLDQVAQFTGGLSVVADTPEELLRAFLDVLDRIFPGDQIPIDGEQRFQVDDDIREFNALLFHTPDNGSPKLVGPDGQTYTRENHPGSVEWLSSDRYDLISVPNPARGEWRIEGEIGGDSRIGIRAGIVLRSDALPATLYRGFDTPLDVWLEDDGERLSGDTLPQGIGVSAELRDLEDATLQSADLMLSSGASYGEASVDAAPSAAGHFRGVLESPETLGNARLIIAARSPQLIRQRVQTVNVVSPLSATLDADANRITVLANHPDLDADNTQLSAQLTGDPLEVLAMVEREWSIRVPETDPGESLPVRITAEAQLDGRLLRFELPLVRLNPDAAISLDGADAGSDFTREGREAAEELESETPTRSLFDGGLTPSEMLDLSLEKARQGWQQARPFVETYAQRPVTWIVVLLILVLWWLWRWRLAVSQRRQRRRAEPSL